MAGIIEQEVNKDNPLKTVQGTTADLVTMGKEETSADRVTDIISKDSDLMQLAGTRGKQFAASRGLLNSSLAAESAQNAVIEKATPLAMQDAQTSATIKLANQGATNTSNQFNAGEKNSAAKVIEAGNQQIRAIDKEAGAEKELIGERARSEGSLRLLSAEIEKNAQILRGDQAKELADIEGRWQTLAATNQAAGLAMQNHSVALSEILKNENIPAEQKQTLVDQQMELMRVQLDAIGKMGGVNVSGLVNFDKTQSGTTTTQQPAAQPVEQPAQQPSGAGQAAESNAYKDILTAAQKSGSATAEMDSLNQMYNYAKSRGHKLSDVSAITGYPVERIVAELAKIGKTLPP